MLLQFQKGDLVRHLGLLDMQRTMQRALRRSGLPIAYSKGFNPHIVMSFASALSSGVSADAELVDVSLAPDAQVTQEACLEAMNRVLPPALSVSRVRLVDDRYPKVGAALRQAQYRITLRGGEAIAIAEAIPAFLKKEEILALRKTKRSEAMVNIRPMIHELIAQTFPQEQIAVLTARVSFVETATLKPDLLLSSLCEFAGVKAPSHEIRRTCLLGLVDDQPVPLIDLQ